MINANEVMMGNVFRIHGHPEVLNREGFIFLLQNPKAECEPIELTAELLKNSGFEREERQDRGFDKFYVWYKDGVDIHEGNEPTDFLYATYVKGAERSFKAGRHVRYLHQLQNLMFALTGQELTFTPYTTPPPSVETEKA